VAHRGDGEISRTIKRRAFTLVEILLVCALLAGPAVVFSARLTERFANPYSSYYIEREVMDTAEWLQTMMRRALIERRDFILELEYDKPDPLILARLTNPTEVTEWRSERVAYRTQRTGSAVQTHFRYSHGYQTMSPGFELEIHAQTPGGGHTIQTEWSIVVSPYGLVRLSRQEK
jgi:hypothetical protein